MRHSVLGLTLAAIASGIVVPAQTPPASPATRVTTLAVTTQSLSELREWDDRINALERSGELVMRTTRRDTLLADRVHERYDQYHSGIRVFGGDIVRQTRHGVTESVFGTLYDDIDLPVSQTLSEDQARAFFASLTTFGLPDTRPIELLVLPLDGGRLALAWRTHRWSDEGWMNTFLDARSGEILLEYNDLHRQAAVGTGTGVLGDRKKVSARLLAGRYVASDYLRPPELITFDARGSSSRALDWLNGISAPGTGDIAADSDNTWVDGANVDAHSYLGWTYDYFYKRFGRKGLDDRNSPIRAITHPVRRSEIFSATPFEFANFYLNASWCGECGFDGRGMMIFGEGLPTGLRLTSNGHYYDYFAGALDIVAHELTHGITDYSSRLIYRNESGALNEAFSDIIGTSVEFYFQTPGAGLRQADYLVGEDISRPGGDRSLSNPGVFGHPDHYSRRYRGSQDEGGVHTNSGIANHAFFLAIEGGVNRTSGLRVTGVGAANREQIEKVFYRAFTSFLTSRATFSMARRATIQAARELYGSGSPAERAVTEAWTAVGVR
jgi:thermolysin